MVRLAVFIPLITILFSSQAFAQDMQPLVGGAAQQTAAQKIAAVIKPEWRACNQDADCTILPYNCSESIAVNKAHMPESSAALCSIGPPIYCSWKKCPLHGEPVVVCGDQHQCITKWAPGNRTTRAPAALRH